MGGGIRDNVYEPICPQETQQYKFTHVDCGPANTIAVEDNGIIHATGDNKWKQTAADLGDRMTEFVSLEQIFPQKTVQVSTGSKHTLILTQEQKVYAMGHNSEGNLGLGHTYSSN